MYYTMVSLITIIYRTTKNVQCTMHNDSNEKEWMNANRIMCIKKLLLVDEIEKI